MTDNADDAAKPAPGEFEKKITQETASTLFQLAWGTIKKIGEKGWEKAAVTKAMLEYAQEFRSRHGDVKVLGMSQPVPLHEIYTAVRVVPSRFLAMFREEDEMEKLFREAGRQQPAFIERGNDQPRDGVDVANEVSMLNILGAPGSGKSTFLRRIGQEAMLARSGNQADAFLHTRYQHEKLPVLIELRRFRDDSASIDLLDRIVDEFETCGFPRSRDFVEGALKHGSLLILLDGLDEVPDARLEQVITNVRDFVDKHSKGDNGNRFLTSCRTAHYRNAFPKFTDVVLADFSDEQIEKFAGNWFSSLTDRQGKTAERFISRLKESAQASTLELARTPLLLTMLCMAFEDRQDLPRTRAAIYKDALQILLYKWAAERRIHNEEEYADLDLDLEVDMLAELAESLFREDRFFFRSDEVLSQIGAFMQGELNAPRKLSNRQILTAIEVQQGLIVRRAKDAYSFSHLTIQEYLTARKLWEDRTGAWQRLVEEELFNERWGVVFELMAGMGKADDLLLAMSAKVQRELASDPEVQALFQWVDRMVVQPSEETSAERALAARSVFVSLSLSHALAHVRILASAAASVAASDFANDLAVVSSLSLSLAFTLDRFLATDPVSARALDLIDLIVWHKLAGGIDALQQLNSLRKLLSDGYATQIDQTPEISEDLARTLSTVLTACRLIVRCKETAYRTTTDGWDRVCNQLLTLPDE